MPILTKEQIETYRRDGILVIDEILTPIQLQAAQEGLHKTLLHHQVDTNNLPATAHHLQKLSSTNGSGGVLDLFYPRFKLDIGCNERLFRATAQLWEAAYCHNGESEEEMISRDKHYMYHPFGAFDCDRGFMYVDRLGYRCPTKLAEEVGAKIQASQQSLLVLDEKNHPQKTKKSKRKNAAIQRSLTPHLDCCPDTYYSSDKSKWRPIQCFVSLTDNMEPNTGGFEAAPGFHHKFHQWTKERPPSTLTKRDEKTGAKSQVEVSAPCIGEYTHIRPKEDGQVMKSVQHIPVRAGSAVFWDNRICHANAYTNESDVARAVVYCSFLPDVPVNRVYAEKQLEDYTKRKFPRDQWINIADDDDDDDDSNNNMEEECHDGEYEYNFSDLGRKLMKIEDW